LGCQTGILEVDAHSPGGCGEHAAAFKTANDSPECGYPCHFAMKPGLSGRVSEVS